MKKLAIFSCLIRNVSSMVAQETNSTGTFLLSGGINSHSANALKAFDHPRLAGYDLNSRFELKPGEKDPERIRIFLNELKS